MSVEASSSSASPPSKDLTEGGGRLERAESEPVCIVCCEPLNFVSIGPCNHPLCCSLCSLKLRIIDRDNKCVYCKQGQERVFITSDKSKRYEDFSTWGDVAGPGLIYDGDGEAFFEEKDNGKLHYEELKSLRDFRCGVPGCPHTANAFPNKKALEVHLRTEHKLHLCNLCWEFRKQFPMEQTRYEVKALQAHKEKGNAKEGMQGHPLCQFCKKRHYNYDMLYNHLNKDHESCHICRSQGKSDDYYRDRRALQKHFRRAHYVCQEKRCMDDLKVFRTEMDLQVHNLQEHPEKSVDRTVKVAFTVKRRGYDGSGFEDRNGSSNNDNSNDFSLDSFSFPYRPGEDGRSSQANTGSGNVSSQNTSATDDFFASGASATGATSASGGRWAQAAGNINVGQSMNSSEEFPSLGGSSGGSNRSAGAGWGYQTHQHHQSSHSSFSNAVGAGYSGLSIYRTAQYEDERKRWKGKKGRKKNQISSRQQIEQNLSSSTVQAPIANAQAYQKATTKATDVADAVRSALNGNQQQFREFQTYCGLFSRREINVDDFYDGVSSLFAGRQKQFARVFPHLVETLPDKGLKDALRQKHSEREYERKFLESQELMQNAAVTENKLPAKSKWGKQPTMASTSVQPKAHVPSHTRPSAAQVEDFPSLSSLRSNGDGATGGTSGAMGVTSAAARFEDWKKKKSTSSKSKGGGVVYLSAESKRKAMAEEKKKKAAKKKAAAEKKKKKKASKTKTSILDQF